MNVLKIISVVVACVLAAFLFFKGLWWINEVKYGDGSCAIKTCVDVK